MESQGIVAVRNVMLDTEDGLVLFCIVAFSV